MSSLPEGVWGPAMMAMAWIWVPSEQEGQARLSIAKSMSKTSSGS